jgi:hypothetical protein
MAAPACRIRDRRTEILAGVAALSLGAWWLYDAYDGRGHTRPFWVKLLPGA